MKAAFRILFSLVLPVTACAENYAIDWFTVAGGGLRSQGANFSLHGTLGQPATGTMANGSFAVVGGFWSFSAVEPPAGAYSGINLADPVEAAADLDGDGLSNLMEYAIGSDPRDPSDSTSAMSTALIADQGQQYVAMGFKRRKSSPGLVLQYIPETTGNSQAWSSASVVQLSVTPIDADFDWVVVRDTIPTTVYTTRGIRLRVVEK
jgi:hypothetical protein